MRTAAKEGDTRQTELPRMPAKNKTTLRAEELAQAVEELEVKKSKVEDRRKDLVAQMRADGLNVAGCVAASGIKYRFDLEDQEAKLKIRQLA